ncbi:hypothetical protein BCR39DRAFT_538189 [Naematelia encephala]|uniref:Uncharacterized protein n=1 Tax=Naematelia encephala TaxID=71784 RepID=A0A1Y2AZ17_9TREE|nr:hypothetical protein BCR39DRAFT_538189 [Naematelia encephala]
MPSCRVTNQTSQPLNICLKQVTALHFDNSVAPGQTIKFRPGRVWFTLEALVDDGTKKTRYSVLKSAATIAVLSLAVGAVAATAGAALLPEAATLAAVASASTAGTYLAKGVTVTKMALIKNSPAIAKISSVALPRAIEKIQAEFGGLTALQREVLSIIASPTLSSDVRHKATSLLRNMRSAYSADKASSSRQNAAESSSANSNPNSNPNHISSTEISATLVPLTEEQAIDLEKHLQDGSLDDRVEQTTISTGAVLRVHGIYMDKHREFQVRVGQEGKLELWDAKENKKWAS